MTWKNRLLPASFRGVPFFVRSHTLNGGRNFKRHEMPGQDGSFNEDLGKKTNGYTIDAYVLGDNYFFLRDSLVLAMKSPDSGLLIHPYLTPVSVQPEGFSLKESTQNGRMATFTLNFGEAGDQGIPLSIIDFVVAFASTANTAIAALTNAFETAYAVSGLPAFVLNSSIATFQDFADTFIGLLSTVKTNPEERAVLTKKIRDFENTLEVDAKDPGTLADKSKELVVSLADVAAVPESSVGRDDRLAIYDSLLVFSAGSDRVPVTTKTREAERQNLEAIENFVRRLALVRYAQQAVDKEFVSRQEAFAEREKIYNLIEIELDTASDEEFQAFSDLQAGLVKAIPARTSGIEKQINVQKQSAIVLAYDLFGNLDAYEDLILRNNVADPSEITGTVEVIG